jgi:hypothetical protein
MVTFDGFGSGSTVTGTFTAHDLSATSHTFVANYVVRESDVTTSIDYEGSVEGSFTTAETVWSGSGTITRDGASPTGTVEATTVDQRRDDTICNNQSLSGTTTLTANDHTATLTYDGATDCDDPGADALWSLDGVPQGSITGISCSMAPGARTSMPLFLLLAAGFVFAFRRR